MQSVFLPMRELAERVREHPVRRYWVPLEYRTSWWLPVTGPDGGLYLSAFFYPVAARPEAPVHVGRPQMFWTVDPRSGEVLEVAVCRYRDFAPHLSPDPVTGAPGSERFPVRTAEEWDRLRGELYDAYDPLLPLVFRKREGLTEAQCDAVLQFRRSFDALVEPFTRPYYEALSPAFFQWLAQLS